VVGHPSYDTLKHVDDSGRITGTLDRSVIWAAQTPQVFRAPVLRAAYARAHTEGFAGTDDASLIEHAGGAVRMLAGPRDNLKITVPEDLAVVERTLKARAEGATGD
jgi:2-C-methyl-D-erythritol 4-phosphate cytidylyltransferase